MDRGQVDLDRHTVTVSFDQAKAGPEAIKKALEAEGDTVLPGPQRQVAHGIRFYLADS